MTRSFSNDREGPKTHKEKTYQCNGNKERGSSLEDNYKEITAWNGDNFLYLNLILKQIATQKKLEEFPHV